MGGGDRDDEGGTGVDGRVMGLFVSTNNVLGEGKGGVMLEALAFCSR